MVIGVQAEGGLFEFGSLAPGHTEYDHSSDTVEFTKDGVTWETMTKRMPGHIIYKVLFNLITHGNYFTTRKSARGLSSSLGRREHFHWRRTSSEKWCMGGSKNRYRGLNL